MLSCVDPTAVVRSRIRLLGIKHSSAQRRLILFFPSFLFGRGVRCACDEGVKDPANRIGLPKRKEIADECDDYHQPISGTSSSTTRTRHWWRPSLAEPPFPNADHCFGSVREGCDRPSGMSLQEVPESKRSFLSTPIQSIQKALTWSSGAKHLK